MASTSRDRILRGALWATAALNVLGGIFLWWARGAGRGRWATEAA